MVFIYALSCSIMHDTCMLTHPVSAAAENPKAGLNEEIQLASIFFSYSMHLGYAMHILKLMVL